MAVCESLRERPCHWCGIVTSGSMSRHLPSCSYPAKIEALMAEMRSRLHGDGSQDA